MPPVTTGENPAVARSRSFALWIARPLLLTLWFTAAGVYETVHLSALSYGDIWWHLRTGLWMLHSHSVPHTGLFSQYSHLPWMASSWGYEVLLAGAYKLIGLRAIPVLLMGFKVALAVVTFLLARAAGANFWTAVFLCALGQYTVLDLQPLPSAFSILFFGVELLLLVQCRRSGKVGRLYWLPPLFVIWANLHLQFVMGLLLLAIFLIALLAEHRFRGLGGAWLSDRMAPLPLAKVGAIAGLSVAGSFATPYSFHLFPLAFKALYSDVAFQYFAEMRAMSFRRPQEYVLMLLIMAAFFTFGRTRSRDVFEFMALAGGTAIAFRIQRDSWLAVLPAVAVLAGGFRRGETEGNASGATRWEKTAVGVLVIAVFLAAALRVPDQNALKSRVSQNFPVKACDFILENHLPQPLYNTYSWGGFLTWYLPEYPVGVDSRVDLYGDEILTGYFKVTAGSERLEADPILAGAGTLLLERQSGMAKAMTRLPALSSRYRQVYSDEVAAVFVRQ